MARKQKPIKIKRYKNSIGTSASARYRRQQIAPVVGAVLALVLVGFLLGKPLLALLAGGGDDESSSQPLDPSSQITDQSQITDRSQTADRSQVQPPVSSQVDNSGEDAVVPPAVHKTRVYYYTDSANLTTAAGIDAVISQMQAKGATHLVFDLKNKDGNLLYTSANQYGSQLMADKVIDLELLTEKLSQNKLTPVARLYTFMDKLISGVERSTAVMYRGTDTRWLDSSAALGGKAWANPASTVMQEYILSITDEIMARGVKEFVFAGFHTPTGYSLDKRDFGATEDQVLANMKNLLNTLEAKISGKGGRLSLQVEYSAIAPEGNYAHYIVHPYQLEAENIIVTAKSTDIDVPAVVSELSKHSNGGSQYISFAILWLTDTAAPDLTASLGDYFVN